MVPHTTTYDLEFDFTSDSQRAILSELQQATPPYTLFGYLAASGNGKLTAGVPAWFARSVTELVGRVTIAYTPDYLIYASSAETIGVGTRITMDTSKNAGLGTSWIFNEDGSFSPGSDKVQPDSILLTNNAPNSVTVGLAAKEGELYRPFCAFVVTTQGAVVMTPKQAACLFVAQTEVQSGTVTETAAAPGAQFDLGSQLVYGFAVEADTYRVYGVGETETTVVTPGYELTSLL